MKKYVRTKGQGNQFLLKKKYLSKILIYYLTHICIYLYIFKNQRRMWIFVWICFKTVFHADFKSEIRSEKFQACFFIFTNLCSYKYILVTKILNKALNEKIHRNKGSWKSIFTSKKFFIKNIDLVFTLYIYIFMF